MRQFSRGTHRHSIPTHPQGAIATHPRVAAKARQITISAVVRRVGLTDSGVRAASHHRLFRTSGDHPPHGRRRSPAVARRRRRSRVQPGFRRRGLGAIGLAPLVRDRGERIARDRRTEHRSASMSDRATSRRSRPTPTSRSRSCTTTISATARRRSIRSANRPTKACTSWPRCSNAAWSNRPNGSTGAASPSLTAVHAKPFTAVTAPTSRRPTWRWPKAISSG